MNATRTEQVTAMVDQAMTRLSFQLVDAKISQNKLNVYLDGANGEITLDECRTASRELEALIDTSGLFPEKYVLEVSSPGARRPLTNAHEFKRVAGRMLSVTLTGETGKMKTVNGVLQDIEPDSIVLAGAKGGQHRISYIDIVKAKIKYVI